VARHGDRRQVVQVVERRVEGGEDLAGLRVVLDQRPQLGLGPRVQSPRVQISQQVDGPRRP
jgi:hypothetical protein